MISDVIVINGIFGYYLFEQLLLHASVCYDVI